MNRYEAGQVIAYLLANRQLSTVSSRRRGTSDERSLAQLLRVASADDRGDVEDILRGMGFDLAQFNDFHTLGLPPGAHVFLATRRLDATSELMSERCIDEGMHRRDSTVTEGRIWFTQLWFVLLSLFYSQRDRVMTEVARYVETTFTRDDLAGAMRQYINEKVRKLGADQIADDAVFKVLTDESGKRIEYCCERFLDLMVDGRLIERQGENKYRQSLLGAVELRNNFTQGLAPWLTADPTDEGPLDQGRRVLVRLTDGNESEG